MNSRWTGFLVWALAAGSAVSWAAQILASPRPVPAGARTPEQVSSANGPMERLFGAAVAASAPTAQAPAESDRFKLMGVIAPGYAIVSIDAGPARTWFVGSIVDGNTALLAVDRRSADFGPPGGPAAFTLRLPEPDAVPGGAAPPAVPAPAPALLAPVAAPPPPDDGAERPQGRAARRHAGRVRALREQTPQNGAPTALPDPGDEASSTPPQ